MSDVVQTIKLFRPQNGDIIVVDFNKVNMTQVENAVKDLKVPVIGVHDLATIQLIGAREQVDHSEAVATLQQASDAKDKEILRLNRIIKDDMVPKAQAVPQPQAVGNLAPKVVPVTNPLPTPSEVKPT